MAGGKHQDKPATETMINKRTLSSRNGCKGTSYVGSGVIGSHQYKQDQRDKDLRALERMKELEQKKLKKATSIQLCKRSNTQLRMTKESDYGTRLLEQKGANN